MRPNNDEPIKNAANKAQVKDSESKARRRRERELTDLEMVLQTPEGRRLLWRVLEHCKVFESIWHPSALIHHNAGKQDVGHFVMSEIVEADEKSLLLMMTENKEMYHGK